MKYICLQVKNLILIHRKQLGVILFEKLELKPVKKTKTGYATNADVLEKLRDKHPIVNFIMEYRQLAKLKSTYCDGLTAVVNPKYAPHTFSVYADSDRYRQTFINRTEFAEHSDSYGAWQRNQKNVCRERGLCACGRRLFTD